MKPVLNWLLVGIGDIAVRRVIPGILADNRNRLIGFVTRNPSKAEPYGGRVWTSIEAALAESDAEAVYIATPVALHAPQSIACLRAGRHVLCEKPMALNYRDALQMQETATANGHILGVAYYRRTYPKVHRAADLIRAGAIGRPVLAELSSHGWFTGEGPRGWLADPAMAGGGPLFDIACHRIDLLNFWFGRPLQVVALRSSLVQTREVEDNATLLIEYESGVRGMVDVRWHSRVSRDECRIRGTDGELDLTALNEGSLRYNGSTENLPPAPNLHEPCIRNFTDAVLDGASLLASGTSSLVTEWVIDRALAVCSSLPPPVSSI